MTASGPGAGSRGGQGIEQKGKRTHGHGQQYGEHCRERGKGELNGNGKKYNKY